MQGGGGVARVRGLVAKQPRATSKYPLAARWPEMARPAVPAPRVSLPAKPRRNKGPGMAGCCFLLRRGLVLHSVRFCMWQWGIALRHVKGPACVAFHVRTQKQLRKMAIEWFVGYLG